MKGDLVYKNGTCPICRNSLESIGCKRVGERTYSVSGMKVCYDCEKLFISTKDARYKRDGVLMIDAKYISRKEN